MSKKVDIFKKSIGAVAGFSVTCLVKAALDTAISNTSGITKVGCYIGAGLVGAWVTKEVNDMLEENIDNTLLVAQAIAKRQAELQQKKEQQALPEHDEKPKDE